MGAFMQKSFGPGAPPLVTVDTTGACASECCDEVEVISSSSSEPHTHPSAHESHNTIPPDVENTCESGTSAQVQGLSRVSGGAPGMTL